jgi:hypothetical protein
MARKRKRQTYIESVEIHLSNGTSFRISPRLDQAYAVERYPGDIVDTVQGPVSLLGFIDMLNEVKTNA